MIFDHVMCAVFSILQSNLEDATTVAKSEYLKSCSTTITFNRLSLSAKMVKARRRMAMVVVNDDRREGTGGSLSAAGRRPGTVSEVHDEAHYDDRSDADDDLEKGRIKFPPAGRLYGRDDELGRLQELYGEIDEASAYARVVFLGGYRGVGKSAVVAELIREIEEEGGADDLLYTCSKLHCATAPFSAISESLGQLTVELMKPRHGELLKVIREEVCEGGCVAKQIMSDIFPPEDHSLEGDSSEGQSAGEESQERKSPKESPEEESPEGESDEEDSRAPSMNEVKEAVKHCMKCICSCLDGPLIWFVDDCQWIDEASLTLLKDILPSEELGRVLFIGAYRSNEVDEEHRFRKLMQDVEESSCDATSIDLFGLSPDDVGEFISDTLDKGGAGEVSALTEVVYAKTMGNIFFIKQALEELTRKNALYYDVMTFAWDYNVNRVQLEDYLSDNVVDIVKSKIEGQPQEVKKLVVVMSLIPNSVSLSTMTDLLKCEGVDSSRVEKLMKYAVKQGLILHQTKSDDYAFVHDKIREASFDMLPKGRLREGLLMRISNALMELSDAGGGNEWALFAAADHLNSVVFSLIDPKKRSRLNDRVGELERLNLRVGELRLARGDVFDANESFRAGLAILDDAGRRWKDYRFTLRILNQLIVTDFALGKFGTALSHLRDVLENATSLEDKGTAYLYRMKTLAEMEDRDYDVGVVEGLKICELYGIKFSNPPKKSDLMKESLQLKAALHGRPLTVLSDLPRLKNDFVFQLLRELIEYALYAGNPDLVAIISDRSIHLALQTGLSKDLITILLARASISMKDLNSIKTANKLAVTADKISQVLRNDNKAMYAETQYLLVAAVYEFVRPWRDCLDLALASYTPLLNAGKTHLAFGSGMSYAFLYLNAGFPLNSPLLEPKLLLFGEAAQRYQMSTFEVFFGAYRQMLLNLRRGEEDWTELKGDAFDEDATLSSVNGKARSMSLRDTSTFRLLLAFVFWDEECMVKMLGNLSDFADPDHFISRSQLRLCFIGLAGFHMGRNKLATKCLDYFRSSSKLGSPNATPIYHFMKAAASPSRERYDKAISHCEEGRLVHLAAMANERCGVFLSELGNEASREYIAEAYWLYREWGALPKANDMLRKHSFLTQATKEYRKSATMTTRASSNSLSIPSSMRKYSPSPDRRQRRRTVQ